MAQIAIVGGMRSGKTLFGVEKALEEFAKGRTIVTNIPIHIYNSPNFYKWDWNYLTSEEEAKKYPWYGKGGVLYLLDECWRAISADDNTVIGRNKWLMSFFREHGKRLSTDTDSAFPVGVSDDIFIINQDLDSIAKRIRILCEQTILVKKPVELGLKNVSIRIFQRGCAVGLEPYKKRVINVQQVTIDPMVANMYDSHDLTNGVKGSYENEGTALNKTVFQGFKFKFMYPALLLLAGYFVFNGVTAIFSPEAKAMVNGDNTITTNKEVKNDTIKNVSPALDADKNNIPAPVSNNRDSSILDVSSRIVEKSVLPVPVQYIDSPNWRISAVIRSKKKGGDLIYLTDTKGHLKRVRPADCMKDDFNQYSCIVAGERVNYYTGAGLAQSGSNGLVSSVVASVTPKK